jgi:uncharacterized protein (DUF2235 family)
MKRLVVCCDGTWNRPDQVHGGVVAPTNVTKLALGLAREDQWGNPQLLHYERGVGTGRWERLRGGAFGLGLSRNVRSCYRFLAEHYEPGDELYLFGFSRGAFTARSLGGLVRNSGILESRHLDRIDDAYALYRARRPDAHPRGIEARIFRRMYSHDDCVIRMLGVWDTVGALGIPLRGWYLIPWLNRRWEFHDTELSSRVRAAYQALAIDERRGAFAPTLWRRQDHAREQTLEQVWFAGAHSDIGGGYPEPELAEITLLWMVDRARACGLEYSPDHFTRAEPGGDSTRRALGNEIGPDPLGTLHDSRNGIYRLLPPRDRALLDADGSPGTDGGAVASTAVSRRDAREDYRPAPLEDYLAAGAPVIGINAAPDRR